METYGGTGMNHKPQRCSLASRTCEPCRGGVPPLKGDALKKLHDQLGNGWCVADEHHLEKEFKFKDFRGALDFTNRVGEMAETIGHHPEIQLGWGRVKITLYTHKIDGLAEADFIFAARVDALR